MLCVVVLVVENGNFSDLKGSALDVRSSVVSLLLHVNSSTEPFKSLKRAKHNRQ